MTTAIPIKKTICQRIFAILLLQLGILTLVIAFPYFLSTHQGKMLFQGWQRSSAIVSTVDTQSSLKTRGHGPQGTTTLRYAYQVNGSSYQGRARLSQTAIAPNQVGEVILIIYDPSQPEQSQTLLETNYYSHAFLIIGLVQVLIALFLLRRAHQMGNRPIT